MLQNRVAITDVNKNPAEDLKYLVVSGEISEKMGNFSKAKDLYKQAISIAQKLEDSKQQSLLVYKINSQNPRSLTS
ncbi:MAG: hypothetical protein HEQ33_04055 [Dolichospermum sp. WA123]|nr:hypothetical protein [Dolichospermum sp. WA123]